MGGDDRLEAAIANYELAFRMQTAVPDLIDLKSETEATKKLYGIGDKSTDIFGRNCLLARRLVERGVRFIEITCPNIGHDRWDQHGNLQQGHEDNARAVDRPIAGLLKDLKARGMLDSTLVIWGGEFGRTPFAQGGNGRDHNPYGFTMWLAGGGAKGGTIHGATDDFGYHAIKDKAEIHDLHATMLHLLGVDHKKQTIRFSARDMRLTDVHGEVIKDIIR
jgi:membrane-anchored protein YejM (alkaline phosphatase superfamily)